MCLKHQLVATSLTTLGDKPEITGLDLSAGEELDLLSQWLGREFLVQVHRIKVANISDLLMEFEAAKLHGLSWTVIFRKKGRSSHFREAVIKSLGKIDIIQVKIQA